VVTLPGALVFPSPENYRNMNTFWDQGVWGVWISEMLGVELL